MADNSDPANIFFNPANVVGNARVYAQGSRWDIAPIFANDDLWTGGGSAGVCFQRANGSTLAADVSYGQFDYGTSVATTPSGQPLGEYEIVESYIALTLGAGFALGERSELRLGAARQTLGPRLPAR
ncbi:MAG: hypothetical protein L0Z51_06330 [Candidatus Latescibacteria bacterium]|nr:hypothetical protein [Candidatus Latescibacterota bacterium]